MIFLTYFLKVRLVAALRLHHHQKDLIRPCHPLSQTIATLPTLYPFETVSVILVL